MLLRSFFSRINKTPVMKPTMVLVVRFNMECQNYSPMRNYTKHKGLLLKYTNILLCMKHLLK